MYEKHLVFSCFKTKFLSYEKHFSISRFMMTFVFEKSPYSKTSSKVHWCTPSALASNAYVWPLRTQSSSHVKAWWYRTSSLYPLTKMAKSRDLRCLWRNFVIICQQIRTTFLIRVQSLCNFYSISKTFKQERSSVIGSIWCPWNQSNRSPNLNSDCFQGIL